MQFLQDLHTDGCLTQGMPSLLDDPQSHFSFMRCVQIVRIEEDVGIEKSNGVHGSLPEQEV
jgi:hypothetical protein